LGKTNNHYPTFSGYLRKIIYFLKISHAKISK